MTTMSSVLILGASGRIGRMLRHIGMPNVLPLWQHRTPVSHKETVIFDPLLARPSMGQFGALLGLAGVIDGSPEVLRCNSDLAIATLEIGASCGARRVFLASTAAVYGRSPSPLREDVSPRPISDYGRAKAEMEDAALHRAAQLEQPVTILRIGNVAGADALLGQPSDALIALDRFSDGQGPRRSYIGPNDLAAIMGEIVATGAAGEDLPAILNSALPGAVAMNNLLQEAGRDFVWRPATDNSLPEVALDVSRLALRVPLPQASAKRIVGDLHAYKQGLA